MALVGFGFTKISAERRPVAQQNVNVESNVLVTNISELPSIDPKKTLLKFEFEFICKYEPGVGNITIDGEIIEIYDKDFASKVLEYWKKEQKIHAEVLQDVFNMLLARSNMEAIVLSRDLGLPSPIQMPRLDVTPVKKDAKVDVKTESVKTESKTDSKDEKKKK